MKISKLAILAAGALAFGLASAQRTEVDLETGEILNTTTGERIQAQPLPGFIQDIARAGGLINYVKGSAQ